MWLACILHVYKKKSKPFVKKTIYGSHIRVQAVKSNKFPAVCTDNASKIAIVQTYIMYIIY